MSSRNIVAAGWAGIRPARKAAAILALVAVALGLAWQLSLRRQPPVRNHSPDYAVEFFVAEKGSALSRVPLRAAFLTTGDLDEATLVARFLDKSLGSNERLRYLRRLMQINSPRSWRAISDGYFSESPQAQAAFARVLAWVSRARFQAILIDALETASDSDAAAAIRGLGLLGGEENVRRLTDIAGDEAWPDLLRREAARGLLQSGDDRLGKQAIRSLALIGMDQDATDLASILNDPSRSEALRAQAAMALGRIASPLAGDELLAAFQKSSNPEFREVLIDALGHQPFARIADTWKSVLDDPATPTELRTAAAEALANSSADAVPFLESLAAGDREADVREMAAWALSAQDPGGTLGPKIATMLRSEPEPDVRRRLYESLLVQAENPADSVIDVIRQEDDPAARVAAMNAAGDAVGRGQAQALAATFDSEMVPELQAVALGNDSLNLRMRAVFALRRAGTPTAQTALANISTTPAPAIATAARNGLQASR